MSRQVLLFSLAALGLFASCLGFADATILEQPLPTLVNDQKNDSAPMVMVHWIGADFVIFEVAGADTFHHLPVKSIHVNYSQVPSRSSWESKSNSPSFQQTHHAKKFTFDRMVNITGLNAGVSYAFEFYLTNTAGEATPSRMVTVLLKPQTPDFSITHQSAGTIRLFWGYPDEKLIDYFLLTVEKKSNPGCGFTLNFTRCFGSSYDLASIAHGETYIFSFISHNPSGDSDTVEVVFPYD